jgi:MFS family permease
MRAFYILSAVIFLQFLAGGTAMPFLALYAQSLGASLINISWIVGSASLVGLAASPWWGWVADRVGRRKPFLVGAIGTLVVTTFLMANATDWWMLLPIRVVEAVAQGAYAVGNLAMMGDILEGHPHRARMIGAYRMSGSLAFAVAIVIAGLVAQSSGFHTTYTVASGIYLTSLLFALALPEPRLVASTSAAKVERVSYLKLLRGPMLPLIIIAATYSLPFSAVYSVWSVWVSEGLELGRATYSQLWGLAAFVEVPAMLLAGFLGDRYGRRVPFITGLSLFALVYLLYIIVPTTAIPLVIGLAGTQVIRGFALAFFTATALTMAIEIPPPEARGRASGLFQFSQSAAGIVGNYSGGFVAQTFGYPTLFALAAAIVALGATYVRVAIGRQPRPASEAVSYKP